MEIYLVTMEETLTEGTTFSATAFRTKEEADTFIANDEFTFAQEMGVDLKDCVVRAITRGSVINDPYGNSVTYQVVPEEI